MTRTIGFAHPGQMGVSIAAAVIAGGNQAAWASEGRSEATQKRADGAGLQDLQSLKALCDGSEMLFSICPPDKAIQLARDVVDAGFKGKFVDCNAVSPATAHTTAEIIHGGGGQFIDGGIVGPPAVRPGITRMYVSGSEAESVPPLFKDTLVDCRVVGSEVGGASALKMAYAGWSKGSTALLMTQVALARAQGVEDAFYEEMNLSLPGIREKLTKGSTTSAPKAWRFVGEMKEIEQSLNDAGLPGAWFAGAADTYSRLSGFKNQQGLAEDEIIDVLLKKG